MIEKEKIHTILRRRPAVHQLCSGAFIQEPLRLTDLLYAVPLSPIGFGAQAHFTAQYTTELTGDQVDQCGLHNLLSQGARALPVVALVNFSDDNTDPEVLENAANSALNLGRRIISWASGDEISPFGVVTLTSDRSFFRLLAPHSNLRQRLGFGNTGQNFDSQISRIYDTARNDHHFDFALSLLHDAATELNPLFRIARYYNVLECLAAKLKASFNGHSRKAVKALIGLEEPSLSEVVIQGEKFRYDPVEIAGRLRDKLFHGVQFREDHLNDASRGVFRLLEISPNTIADSMKSYCEIEIARWANGASKGRQ